MKQSLSTGLTHCLYGWPHGGPPGGPDVFVFREYLFMPIELLICLWLIPSTMAADAKVAVESPQPAPRQEARNSPALDQAALEKEFSERLSGAVFAGRYSVTIDGEEKPSQVEKYTISKVTKIKEDYWLFAARIQYGKHDLTVPMQLQVKWAGDTPVITLTNLTIPGLGTFTSRVLVHGDRYSGTWQHDKVGGHLWGRIEKPVAEEKVEKKE
ncbi:MAG: hypothetical protein ACKV0T_27410 [Planctomycetales bacterium]